MVESVYLLSLSFEVDKVSAIYFPPNIAVQIKAEPQFLLRCCLQSCYRAGCEEFSRGIQNLEKKNGLKVKMLKKTNIFLNGMVPREQKLGLFLINILFHKGLFEKSH